MSANLLVATIETDRAGSVPADWITSNGDPHRAIDVLDFPANVLTRVYWIYQKSYSELGPLMITSADGLFKYDRWFLIYDLDLVPRNEFPDERLLVAFALCRETSAGIKVGFMGSDSRRGAKAIVDFVAGMLMIDGVFAEVSGRPENRFASRVPIVRASDAIEILAKLGHPDATPTEDDHYERTIKGIGRTQKLMVGRPRLTR